MESDILTSHSSLFASRLDHNFLIRSFFFPRASNWLRFCIPCIMCPSRAMLCFVTQSCPVLCILMDCSPPGSSVRGIFQARILEWVARPSSRGSSRPKDRTQVSHIVDRHFTVWATRESSIQIAFLSGSDSYFKLLPQSLQMVIAAMKLKDAYSLEEKLWPT